MTPAPTPEHRRRGDARRRQDSSRGKARHKFPKSARILKRADFQRVYHDGRRYARGPLVVFVVMGRPKPVDEPPAVATPKESVEALPLAPAVVALPPALPLREPSPDERPAAEKSQTPRRAAPGPSSRMGVTATKKMGKAHDRNRAKRLVREAWRHLLPELRPGFDVVVNCRSEAARCHADVVADALRQACADARLLKSGPPPRTNGFDPRRKSDGRELAVAGSGGGEARPRPASSSEMAAPAGVGSDERSTAGAEPSQDRPRDVDPRRHDA